MKGQPNGEARDQRAHFLRWFEIEHGRWKDEQRYELRELEQAFCMVEELWMYLLVLDTCLYAEGSIVMMSRIMPVIVMRGCMENRRAGRKEVCD